MKKLLIIFVSYIVLLCTDTYAEDITLNWLNEDGTTNQTTTCTIGGDLILPQTPTKLGYDFIGWAVNYIPVEYLENIGRQQYINTKYKFSNIINARIVLDAVFFNDTAWKLTGVAAAAGGPNIGIAQGGNFSYTAGTTTDQITNVAGNSGERYLFDLNIPNATYTVSDMNDNILVNTTINRSNRASNNPFILFGYRTSNIVHMRVYSLKIWDNGTLVRDMVPALDIDGTPCMYDFVNGEFYYNAGSGSFFAGTIITE